MTATETLPSPKHPAKFSDPILDLFARLIRKEADRVVTTSSDPLRVLDPFAGVGRVHRLHQTGLVETTGVEIEPEWAACHSRTICADALRWMRYQQLDVLFDAVITSPCYGNRFSDHHDAKDGSVRRSYRHDLGRMPTEGSAAVLPWGPAYWEFHAEAYQLIYDVLRPGGLFLLNVSDFVRNRKVVHAADWHDGACWGAGFVRKSRSGRYQVATDRLRYGENYTARVDAETVFAFRKPERQL